MFEGGGGGGVVLLYSICSLSSVIVRVSEVINRTGYYNRFILESWFTNLEQRPLNQQLPAAYKRLVSRTDNQTELNDKFD